MGNQAAGFNGFHLHFLLFLILPSAMGADVPLAQEFLIAMGANLFKLKPAAGAEGEVLIHKREAFFAGQALFGIAFQKQAAFQIFVIPFHIGFGGADDEVKKEPQNRHRDIDKDGKGLEDQASTPIYSIARYPDDDGDPKEADITENDDLDGAEKGVIHEFGNGGEGGRHTE